MNNKFWSANPLPRYEAKTVWKNRMSYMCDRLGNSVPSFSTIINATKSPAEKMSLKQWRQNIGNQQANQIITSAIQRGKLGHRHLEGYFNGENVPCPAPIAEHWHHLLPVLECIHNIKLLEGNVFHFYEGYAGRVDCVASFNEIDCVIDFKFCDRLKPFYDEPLQLAAYCGALNRQYGLGLKAGLLIVATPDQCDITLFQNEEMMKYWRIWQRRVAQFWQQYPAIAA